MILLTGSQGSKPKTICFLIGVIIYLNRNNRQNPTVHQRMLDHTGSNPCLIQKKKISIQKIPGE